jgi:Sulfotransferase family
MTGAESPHPVFPFFVGSGRSGTTLIRAMFDSHPDMAVPDESNFIPRFGRVRQRYEKPWGFASAVFLRDLFRQGWFRQSGISQEAAWDAFDSRPPADLASGIREVFALYARLHGKSRYADKTPNYVLHVPLLAGLFPEARFVHLIRDGREVAMSLLDVGFGPRTMREAALQWRERVAHGLAYGRELGPSRCRQVRYEDLLEDPAGTVASLCDFVGLGFDPMMLQYFERAESIASSDVYKYRSVRLPPTRNLRDWRTQMSKKDLTLFEAIAGDVLEEVGYERGVARFPLPARVNARARVLGAELRQAPRDLRKSIRRKQAKGNGRPFTPMACEPGDGRHHAVSFLLAREAAEDPRVASFRAEVMGKRVVPLDRLEQWVAEQAAKDGEGPPAGTLGYVGSHGLPVRQPTTKGGVLEDLRSLVGELVKRYGWEHHQASSFVLTDPVPVLEPIRSSITGRRPKGPTTRLVPEVDPANPASDVLKHYKALRRQLFPGQVPRIEDKRLMLSSSSPATSDEPSEALMRSWNDAHPNWAYRELAEFKRDARLTRQRLVETAW